MFLIAWNICYLVPTWNATALSWIVLYYVIKASFYFFLNSVLLNSWYMNLTSVYIFYFMYFSFLFQYHWLQAKEFGLYLFLHQHSLISYFTNFGSIQSNQQQQLSTIIRLSRTWVHLHIRIVNLYRNYRFSLYVNNSSWKWKIQLARWTKSNQEKFLVSFSGILL